MGGSWGGGDAELWPSGSRGWDLGGVGGGLTALRGRTGVDYL